MANQDLKAKLTIEAGATGGDEIEAIASELSALARESGAAAPKLDSLAQSLREAAQQERLIEGFAQAKREVQATAGAMDAASAKVDALAAELARAGDAARQAGDAQQAAAQGLAVAKQHQEQLRDAVAQARQELKQSKQALQQAGQDSAGYAERVRDSAGQLKLLQAEERAATGSVRLLAAAHKEASAASANAANAQKQMAGDYGRAVDAAGQLSIALSNGNQALADARAALSAAGIDTKGLSAQQAELKTRLLQAQQQAQQYVSVVGQMRGEMQSLTPALDAMFKKLGMRGVQQISAEMDALKDAMRGLRDQDLLPKDAARLTAELQKRMQALRAEMGGAQGAAQGAGQAVQALGAGAQSAGEKLGAAAHKALAWTGALVGLNEIKRVAAAVLETGSSFEQLERRLTGILGSTEKASAAFAMLKDLAQKTPFDVQGLTEAFAKLSAFGLEPSRQQMLAMADAAAQLGGGTEMLEGVTLALGQAWTKGKLQGEEMLQLAERGVPAWDLLAQATGKSVQQLQKMSEAGQLGREAILQLIDAMGKKSAGASADLMNSYAGAVQRAQDALQEFFNMIAQSGVLEYLTQQLQELLAKFEALKASGGLDQWARAIADGFKEVAEKAQNIFSVLQALAPVIEAVVVAMALSKVGQWASVLTSAGKAAADAAAGHDKLGQAAQGAGQPVGALGAVLRLGLGEAAVWAGGKVLELVAALGELKRARERVANAQALGAKLDAEMAQRLADISAKTGVLVQSFEELEAAQRSGALVQNALTGQWLSAAQAQEKLAAAASATKDGLDKLARSDASALVAGFDAAAKAAGGTEEAVKKLVAALQPGDLRGVAAFALALDELAATGRMSAKQVGEAWQQALAKLDTGQLGALRAQLEEAARQGVLSAEQKARANEQVLAASFTRLGVNAAQALGKISEGAQEAMAAVDLVADAAKAAGVAAADAARAVELAFAAAIPKADSLQAVDAMAAQLKALGDAGRLSAEGVERSRLALDAQRAAIEAQLPGIQGLQEALRELGVKPQAQLDALARKAKEAFAVVQAAGTATPREVGAAWKAMAEASIAANDGVADAALRAQAAQFGFVVEADAAGKAVVKAMAEAKEATEAVGGAAKGAAQGMQELGEAAWQAGRDLVAQAREHNAALETVQGSWLQAGAAASKYAQQAAALVHDATKSTLELGQAHAHLVQQLEALDAQQQQVQVSSQGAAQGVADLQLRLLELDGSEEQVAAARAERARQELRDKLALQQIEMERARLLKDDAAVQRYADEAALLGEQIKLLDQVHQREKALREEKARTQAAERKRAQERAKEQEQERAAQRSAPAPAPAPTRSAPAAPAPAQSGGGMASSAPPVTINFNANGINDPVKLAKQLEPELKRLGLLNR